MATPLLLVDDDTRLAQMLSQYLGSRGWSLSHRGSGEAGLAELEAAARPGGLPYDVVILDIMMPGIDGLEVLRRLRAHADPRVSTASVLMLTARGDELDRVVGLELGADDYLPKPFHPRELAARLDALRRRQELARTRLRGGEEGGGILAFGDLEIDLGARQVRRGGVARELTSHQFELLVALAERAGRVLSRAQLMQLVRGEELEAYDRSIDVHISRIRAAIEADPRKPRRIQTVRGAGYVFVADEGA